MIIRCGNFKVFVAGNFLLENCQNHTFSVEIGRGCWSLKDHKLLTLSSVLFIVMEILEILKVLEEIEKMEKSIRC